MLPVKTSQNREIPSLAAESRSNPLLDWTFRRIFRGLVYNQVWEDPLVDLQALALSGDHRVVMIGSAGCNALAYLSADVKRVDAVDINQAHRALFMLKRTALERLPDRAALFRLLGSAQDAGNVATYDSLLVPHLPESARAYWSGRTLSGRRIGMFRSGFYRHGALARFVGLFHKLARLRGCLPDRMVRATSLADQGSLFRSEILPALRTRFAAALSRNQVSLFALGIPPAQYQRLREGADDNLTGVLLARIERLACAFPISENPFAWQAFARCYGPADGKAIPMYLEPQVYDAIQPRAGRVHLHAMSVTDYLATQEANSVHRFVLLDAQDWMSLSDVAALWKEIGRTAHAEDARVLFRTAGLLNPFQQLPQELRRGWRLRDDLTPAMTASDRTALYHGVHLIERRSN